VEPAREPSIRAFRGPTRGLATSNVGLGPSNGLHLLFCLLYLESVEVLGCIHGPEIGPI
jgi:hypothetical protein